MSIWFAVAKGGWKLVSSKPVRLALARYILDNLAKNDKPAPKAEEPKQS